MPKRLTTSAALQATARANAEVARAILVQAEAIQSLANDVRSLALAVGQMVCVTEPEQEGEDDDGAKYVQLMNGQRIKVS